MRTSLIKIGKTSGQLLSLTSDMLIMTIPESLTSGTIKLRYIQVKQIDFAKVNVRFNHTRCRSYTELSYLASPWTFKLITQKAEQMKFPIKQFVHSKKKQVIPKPEPDSVTPVTQGINDMVQSTVEGLRKTWDLIENHSHYLNSYKGGMSRYTLPRPGIGYQHEKKINKDTNSEKIRSKVECQRPIFKSRIEEDAWNEKQDALTLEAISIAKKEQQRKTMIEESQLCKSIKRTAHFVLPNHSSAKENQMNKLLSSHKEEKSTTSNRDESFRLSACRISIAQAENKSGIEKSKYALENMTVTQFSQFLRKVKPFASEQKVVDMLINEADQGHKLVKKTFCKTFITDQLILRYFSEYNWCL